MIEASKADIQVYVDAGETARQSLAGKLYSAEFLARVEKELATFRSGKTSSK